MIKKFGLAVVFSFLAVSAAPRPSRMYAGIHNRSDIEMGKEHGKRLAGYTVRFAQTDGAVFAIRTATAANAR